MDRGRVTRRAEEGEAGRKPDSDRKSHPEKARADRSPPASVRNAGDSPGELESTSVGSAFYGQVVKRLPVSRPRERPPASRT